MSVLAFRRPSISLRSEAQHHADLLMRRRRACPITAASVDLVQAALEKRIPEAARETLEQALIGLDAVLQGGREITEAAAQELKDFVAEVTA